MDKKKDKERKSIYPTDKIIGRYLFIVTLFCILAIGIIGRISYLMFTKKAYWNEVATRFVKEGITLPAQRGNILSCDGKLMCSSLPEYKIFIDYRVYEKDSVERAKLIALKDSAFKADLDSLCYGLNQIFPNVSAAAFRAHLIDGKIKNKAHWPIVKQKITNIQYKELKKLPLFRLSKGISGFHTEDYYPRKRPFGLLASRIIGGYSAVKDSGLYGMELTYDSLLRGVPGLMHRQKTLNKWLNYIDQAPIDGYDLVSTIDMNIQDVAEKSLRNKLKEIGGDVGMVVLLEVKTGEVKAIVNLTKAADGCYYELNNNALSDLMEPGSTFKTSSFMVALEDGYIHLNDSVNTGSGIMKMHGKDMKDHNWRRGGYQWLTVPKILMVSSNIGVSYLIDKYYGNQPEKYVSGLNRCGVGIPLHIQMAGYMEPRVRHPNKKNWWKTTLPWMSIGYETQLPVIATVNFYNAIANGGKMVRPHFLKAIMKDGEVIQEMPVEVIKERICSPKTLEEIQWILERVVSKGLGKHAGNPYFKVSGKTGTAMVASGKGGYRSGIPNYMVSFCGYYPSDAPKYSCIVAIKKKGLPASGGGQCGPVFSEIAQAVMAREMSQSVADAKDTVNLRLPSVKKGNLKATESVLSQLSVPYKAAAEVDDDEMASAINEDDKAVVFTKQKQHKEEVPNVLGMGARDAVYTLEKAGLKVNVTGMGHVKSQSINPGSRLVKGQTIKLTLSL